MISPKEIKEKASRKYKDFLKYEISLRTNNQSDPFFPFVIRGDTGSVNDDLLERQKELQLLISKSKNKTGTGYTLELETINSRKNGAQTDIKKIFLENKDDFLSLIDAETSFSAFNSALDIIQKNYNFTTQTLQEWATTHISELCKHVEERFWDNICLCSKWLDSNKNTNLYIREIPLPVHTKFIENNKSLIKSLTSEADSQLDFEDSFGLKSKPTLIRLRALDITHSLRINNETVEECTIPVTDLNTIKTAFENITNIFIVENEMIFLTFPKVKDSICIWGHGFTVTALKEVKWLNFKKLYYFGDLDEHGFEILSNFRTIFPTTCSFCMDMNTFEEFKPFRVRGEVIHGDISLNLTEEELKVFNLLQEYPNLNRLEQERISQQWIMEKLNNVLKS